MNWDAPAILFILEERQLASTPMTYNPLLVVSFGGPESKDEVMPFLENVLRGKNVPSERMLAVAEHYYHFDGRSPINQQNRELIAALQVELDRHGPKLPIYWGNRNWHPLLADTLRQMEQDGVQRALAFVTSAFSSYSGCRLPLGLGRAQCFPDTASCSLPSGSSRTIWKSCTTSIPRPGSCVPNWIFPWCGPVLQARMQDSSV